MADAGGGGQLEGMGYHKVDDVDGGNEDYEIQARARGLVLQDTLTNLKQGSARPA